MNDILASIGGFVLGVSIVAVIYMRHTQQTLNEINRKLHKIREVQDD